MIAGRPATAEDPGGSNSTPAAESRVRSITEGWGRYASFRDPEGNWLQIFKVFDTR